MNFAQAHSSFSDGQENIEVKTSCESYLSLPFRGEKRPALQLQDKERIQRIFDNDSRSMIERANEAYVVYLQARLRQLDPDIRSEVFRKLLELRAEANPNDEFEVLESRVSIPTEFIATALPWMFLAHEHEHRIQKYRLLTRPKLHQLLLVLVDQHLFGLWVYHAEKQAMQAEWEILSILPERFRQETVEALYLFSEELMDAGRAKLAGDVRFYASSLDAGGLSRDEYVRGEHRKGRYSKLSYLRQSVVGFSALGGALFLMYLF